MSAMDTINQGIRKIFGSRNDRVVRGYRQEAEACDALEAEIRPKTDAELKARTEEIQEAVRNGTPMSDVLYETLAIMRESIDRNIGIRNIFNPAHKDEFDPDRLPPDARALYDQVWEEIERTPETWTRGSDAAVPGWLQVDIPPRLYDAVRELYRESRPPFRARPFTVQMIGALVLYHGKIAEMKTGEGKTIVAPMACFAASIEGLQCHVITVNDYLVQRDRDWVFPAFHKLGKTVGAIHPIHIQEPEKKQEAYQCDVVYGTNAEFGFDYLRDNMKMSVDEQVQKRRDFCIIDEIDSILIDEARTPLIISGPAHDDAPQYMKANEAAEHLVRLQKQADQETRERISQPGFVAEAAKAHKTGESSVEEVVKKFRELGPEFVDEKEADLIGHRQYYVVKKEQKQASMTGLGVEEAQKVVGTRFYVVGADMAWDHLINNALRAHTCYEHDKDYIVEEGEVVIIDVFTGRKMVGRQWSDGLHQAVEAKEAPRGAQIKKETQTLATITIQNFFKLYKRLAGMTGTATTQAVEFHETYKLDVVSIPTNEAVIRVDHNDLIFLTADAKWNAVVEEIRENAEAGRPVLVGTTSVEKSQVLSDRLTKQYGLDHEVLNAKNHAREAQIIAKAGEQHVDRRGRTIGNVTIATNMAGRGTDIMLTPETKEAGGLHVIGTERHEARRIDNQLRGRGGRQGDPGSSRFYISMEDDLMKMFAGGATTKALTALGMQEDDAIEHRWISRSVERAQKKVEERNYEIRKNLLQYDEVMEHQRSYFYSTRQRALEGRDVKGLIFEYLAESIEDAVGRYLDPDYVPSQISEAVQSIFSGLTMDPKRLRGASLEEVAPQIRTDAKADARGEIETTIGEYLLDDADPSTWDLRGLAQWAMSRFNVDLKQSQMQNQSPQEITEEVTRVAHEQIDRKPLDSLQRFFEAGYAERELANWAREKFGLELSPEELSPGRHEKAEEAQQRVGELVYARAVEAYQRREVVYPVEFILEMAFGMARQGEGGGAWAAEELARWARQRYALDWTPDSLAGMTGDQLEEELVRASEQWNGPALGTWVEQTLADNPSDDTLDERFRARWDRPLWDAWTPRPTDGETDRAALIRDRAKEVLRTELTQLEQYVLLQILDQSWKDHLYAMDQLKDSVGLRGFAQRDPKIEYKTEGAKQFHTMLEGVRDKVTDLIFKAKLTPEVEMPDTYQGQTASHETQDSMGVAEGGESEEKAEDLAAAERAGNEEEVVQTIVNKGPRVGRNDPCPCGSGKKYKKCCGAA